MKALDRTLQAWAKEYRAQLDPSIVKLIEGAQQDLHFGPAYGEESDFPGFEMACLAIKSALDDVPSTLYVDTDSEWWTDDGNPPDENDAECFIAVERRDLVRALVGKELAEYV